MWETTVTEYDEININYMFDKSRLIRYVARAESHIKRTVTLVVKFELNSFKMRQIRRCGSSFF